jgi:hypothetical protein
LLAIREVCRFALSWFFPIKDDTFLSIDGMQS